MRMSVTLFLASVFLFLTIPQKTQALTLIPPSFEVELTPGQPYDGRIKLFNEADRTVTLYSEITNFTAKDETGNPSYSFDAPLEGMALWIDIEKGPFILEPKERVEIPFSIRTPDNAEPGGHYAIIFLSDQPPATAGGGKISVGSKIGSLIMGRVAGEIVEDGSIASFSLDANGKILTRLPAHFAVRYQNSGNAHLRPSGTITVKNLFGRTTKTLDINATKSAVLPRSTRKFEAVWEKNEAKTTTGGTWSQFWTELRNEKSNFAFGRYTAELTLVAGQNQKIENQATLPFWVIPWRLLIIVIIALGIVGCFFLLILKRYNKWIIRQARQQFESPAPLPFPPQKKRKRVRGRKK